jgi:hypothetical protein
MNPLMIAAIEDNGTFIPPPPSAFTADRTMPPADTTSEGADQI